MADELKDVNLQHGVWKIRLELSDGRSNGWWRIVFTRTDTGKGWCVLGWNGSRFSYPKVQPPEDVLAVARDALELLELPS